MPHFHVSGIHGITVFLFIIVAFGSAHLAATAHPDKGVSQAWLALGF